MSQNSKCLKDLSTEEFKGWIDSLKIISNAKEEIKKSIDKYQIDGSVVDECTSYDELQDLFDLKPVFCRLLMEKISEIHPRQNPEFKVQVRLSDRMVSFAVSSSMRVSQLRSMVIDYVGNEYGLQLRCGSEILDDDKTIGDYNIISLAPVLVIFKLKGVPEALWRCSSTTNTEPGYFLWTTDQEEKIYGFECINNGQGIKILHEGQYHVNIKVGWESCGTPDALFVLKLNGHDLKAIHRQKDVNSFYGEFDEKKYNATLMMWLVFTTPVDMIPKKKEIAL